MVDLDHYSQQLPRMLLGHRPHDISGRNDDSVFITREHARIDGSGRRLVTRQDAPPEFRVTFIR